jgi:energy-coupling factor transporter ATP-binding protein EcfA2
MYLHQVSIHNIRSIQALNWMVRHEEMPGWHVVLGDNGSGKSTFVKAIALALIGQEQAKRIVLDWNEYLRRGVKTGEIYLDASHDPLYDPIEDVPEGVWPHISFGFAIHRTSRGVFTARNYFVAKNPEELEEGEWRPSQGWFSVAYGPFRRFLGGEGEYDEILRVNSLLAAHISVLSEKVALAESLRWLIELDHKRLEQKPEGAMLGRVREFVNQPGFLPHYARLENVSSDGVTFTDGDGCEVPIEEMGDGYRSILSLTLELIRQMTHRYKPEQIFSEDGTAIAVPGVVLVDEIDTHLHPSWQRRIGFWFRKHFPKIQFIVTTHSPLICQAASKGSIFRLPTPGTNEEGRMLEGIERDRLIYGNVLEAYSTEMFGRDITRSEEAQQMLQRLAELNLKELSEELPPGEFQERERLRAIFATSPNTVRTTDRK